MVEKTKKRTTGIILFIICPIVCPYSAGASAAGMVVVAAGISVEGRLGTMFSSSLLGVPSLEFFGRVMLESKQSETNTAANAQVPFSRKSVV